jgi:N-hydroxyarylamine O-acetyltransferase
VDPGLLTDVLAKMGVDRVGLEPDTAGLHHVYGAWCHSVPFDNVVKRIHLTSGDPAPIPNGDPEYFFTSWLEHGTGGTCWPSTLAMHAVLAGLGFDVRIASGAMRDDIEPDSHSHGTLLVTTPDGPDHDFWLVDTSMLTETPVSVVRHAETDLDHPLRPIRIEPVGDLWRVHWQPVGKPDGMTFLFLDDDVTEQHCRDRYEWSREHSGFNASLYATRDRAGAADEFVTGEHVVRDADGIRRRAVDPAARNALLSKVFGYSDTILEQLPPDQT